jgi:hypothetical protein
MMINKRKRWCAFKRRDTFIGGSFLLDTLTKTTGTYIPVTVLGLILTIEPIGQL